MTSQFDDLQRLTEMRDKGDISQDEFQRLKAQLLDETTSQKPASEATDTQTNQMEGQTRWWLVGTGTLMAVGSLLPWASAGIFSAAGTEGDGILTLIGGVVVALIGIANRVSMATGIAAVIVSGASLWIVVSVFGRLETDLYGSGLYLTALASLMALVAGFQLISQARKT